MGTMVNPYIAGAPVTEERMFFGREDVFQWIENSIAGQYADHILVIHGQRRVGKTSVLKQLGNRLPKRYIPVFFDLQGRTHTTLDRFLWWLAREIVRVLKQDRGIEVPLPEKEAFASDLEFFEHRFLPDLKPALGDDTLLLTFAEFDNLEESEVSMSKGLTIVLLMDEFEYVTENPYFRSDFFGGLRALAIHHGVALIPATRRELVDLCHSDEIKGSPFFNIFANVVLRPLSRYEVDELVDGYTRENEFALTPQERDFIWGLGGGYPIFVQMAGHYLLEGRTQGLNGDALTRFAVTSFDQQADAHYTYLWSHCSESEKITLLILLTLSMQKPTKKTIPNVENLSRLRARAPQDMVALGKRGLVDESNGIYSLFSPSLERWIRQEIVAAPGEAESQTSAEEWLKSGKREDLRETKGVLPRFKRKYWPLVADIAKELSFEFAAAGTLELIKVLL